MKQKGFTLVELAIVLMIIGLLIGGILKGQELIQNARITTAIRQFRAIDAAVLTFMDSYGALPGDIANPATRLPNCSTAMCNTAGNGDGLIGVVNSATGDEKNAAWLHLGAAGLISGVDQSRTWTSGNYNTAWFPTSPLGNNIKFYPGNSPPGANYLDGIIGNHYYGVTLTETGVQSNTVPVIVIARLDTKIDDGHPYRGDVKLFAAVALPFGSTTYATSDSSLAGPFLIKAGF